MAEFTSNTDKGVILVSGDNEEFQVSSKAASLSVMVHNIIGEDDQDDERRIPLPNVRKEILSKVLEFCNHYTEEKMTEFVKPLQDPELSNLVQKFYADYITGVDKNTLFELTLAANYMDIKPLLDLCCARIASFIKDKSPEEIRSNLDIVNDFTPEEENQVRAENAWADDV